MPRGVTAKDIVLAIIGKIGTAGGTGHTIEFAGSAIRALSMEGRMTVCNMAIEAGARAGLVAVDEKTLDYVQRPPLAPAAPHGTRPRRTGARCRATPGRTSTRSSSSTLPTSCRRSPGARRPEMVVAIDGRVPDPEREKDSIKRGAMERALTYMGLEPNKAIDRHRHRQGLHWLLHQQPHRGSARGGRRGSPPRAQRRCAT